MTFPLDCIDCGATFQADDFDPACPPCEVVRAEMASEIVQVLGLLPASAKWVVGAVLRRHYEEQRAYDTETDRLSGATTPLSGATTPWPFDAGQAALDRLALMQKNYGR